jgi:tetratricopeptide (TPR) repeat protein
MAYERISRSRKRELEAPDEFITVSSRMVQFIAAYKKQMGLAMGVAILLVLVFAGLYYHSGRTEKVAMALLETGMKKYGNMDAEASSKKVFLDVKPDFEAILEKYPGKNAAKIARLIYADLAFDAGEFDTAINLYTRAVKDFKKQPFYGQTAQTNLAYAHEAKEDYAGAINLLEALAAQPKMTQKDSILFDLGRMYAKNNQKDKEAQSYQRIVAEFPNSPYADMAKEKIDWKVDKG